MLIRPLLFVYLLSASIFVSGQQKTDTSQIDFPNMTIPESIREGVEEALAFYPELHNTAIDFVFKDKIKHSYMQAQPRWYGMFQGKKKRRYIIKVSSFFDLSSGDVPVEQLPREILVGWIGHELGHILDYVDRSAFGMMGFGISYVTSKKKMIEAENRADIIAIKHGLGDYILSCKEYVLESELFSKEYRDRIHEHYMSPEEVVEWIEATSGVVSTK
jgi:hypothetical protein